MITTIILSKDRSAQLDLLLRSIERNSNDYFDWKVLWQGDYIDDCYSLLWSPMRFAHEGEDDEFEFFVRAMLDEDGRFVCFMCDDGILYRPIPPEIGLPHEPLALNEEMLCLSLRLGQNTTTCYPSGLSQKVPPSPTNWEWGGSWDWTKEPQDPGVSDFGYPGSIDGHVFRTADVRRMLNGRSFPNPTALECALVEGCRELASERPLMACYPQSVYVGVPVNRVSEQSNVRYGTRFPFDVEQAKRRFLAGERLDLDRIDFSGVDGAHAELELIWR